MVPDARHPHKFKPVPLAAALAGIGFCSLLIPALTPAVHAQQLPTGGSVVQGSATIRNLSGTRQQITQGTDRAIINWQGFSIGQGASVRFVQPGAGSVVLNRVVGNDPSSIFGSLSSNGQVFLVNPRGIYFSPTASLDVGGLVASTLDIRDGDFMAGRFMFRRDPSSPETASVVNEGVIQARDGGYVVLAGDYAANRGVIEARLGTVALASGSRVTLDMHGDSLVSLAVNEKTLSQLAGVENSGQLAADGGRVVMTAAVARDLAGTVVNNTGLVRATGTVERDGAIYLTGDGGDVSIGGRVAAGGARGGYITIESTGTTLVTAEVTARGSEGRGGDVRILGERVGLVENARVDASGTAGGGTVLIGGDFQGRNPDVRNAERTYVGENAAILADATRSGDGGKVIVWADDVARYFGSISARGGSVGGNGGFAEVSGKQSLVYDGAADLRASQGATGTLLLDPKDIRVTAGGADAVAGNSLFGDNAAGTSDLSAANVIAAMNGANLALQANNDITVETSLNVAGGAGTAGRNLTLQAGRHIILASTPDTATPTNSTGAVTVTMNNGAFNAINNVNTTDAPGFVAANRDAGAAQFFMASGSAIAGASSVSITAGNNNLPTLNANTGAFNIGNVTTTGGAITISAFNDVNLNGTLTTGGGSASVTADGNLTVAATGSIAAGAGTVSLTTTEALNPNASILLGGNVAGGLVKLTSADTVTQSAGGITASGLAVRAATGNVETVDLAGPNNVGTLAAVMPGTTTPGANVFNFSNGANALTIGTVDGLAGIDLAPTTPPPNTAVSITAGNLTIGNPIITGAGNGVVTLQQPTGSAISIFIGTNTAFGLTQAELDQITTGALRIGNTGSTGNVVVTAPITESTGWNTLTLRSGGTISQTAGSTVAVTNFGVQSTSSTTLNEANAVTTFAAASDSALQFTNGTGFTVGTVDALTGIDTSSGNANARLNAGGLLNINQNVDVGTGMLTFNTTAGGVAQDVGSGITATGSGGVRLLGAGTFNLGQTNANDNNIANVAANVGGSVAVRNGNGVTLHVEAVGSTAGITTGGGSVALIADQMTFTQGVNTAGGSVTLTTSNAATTINVGSGSGGLSLTDAKLDKITTTNLLTIGDNAHTGAVSVNGAVNPNNATGGITLRNQSGGIAINGVLTAAGGTSGNVNLIADGGSALPGAITQGASGGIVANVLTTRSAGGTALTGSGNQVDTFTASEFGGGSIPLTNTGALTVSGVQTSIVPGETMQNVTISTTGNLTVNTPISTQNPGDPGNGVPATPNPSSSVSLTSTGGSVTLGAAVEAGSTGTVTLNAAGTGGGCAANVAICQTGGAITGGQLRVSGLGGNVSLTQAGNDVATIAANVSDQISYTDTNALTVGTVGATSGITASRVTLQTGGTLTLAQNIASSGTISLTANSGGVNQTGGAVTGTTLTLGGAGTYSLAGANDVNSLSASVNGPLTFTDTDGLSATGISTGNGNVTLNTGNTLAVTGSITAGSGRVTLNPSAGGVNQTGGGISANTLLLTGAGNFNLNQQATNSVGTLAANVIGTVTYADKNALTIGTVGGVSGVTSGGNDISLTAQGPLNVTRHVNAGSGDVTLTTLETAASNDNINLTATPNAITGDMVRLISADAINQAGGAAINANNLFTQAESGNNVSASVTGEVWYDLAGETTFSQNVVADRVVIWSSAGSPTINQTAGSSINAAELLFIGFDGNPVFNFTSTSNNVNTVSGASSYSALGLAAGRPTINYRDSDALNVGLINTTSFVGTVQGITTRNGNVTLRTGGALSLNEGINAGSGRVTFNVASGGVNQSAFAPVKANFLNMTVDGNVDMGTAGNNLLALGENASKGVTITNGSHFTFNELNNVEVRGPVRVSNAGPASIDITAGDTLTVKSSGSLSATSTGNVSPADVTLSGTWGVALNGAVNATGGGSGAGINAGVTVKTTNGPITMGSTGSITATDNGPSTADPAVLPHSAQVKLTAGGRSGSNCVWWYNCSTQARNITATSANGRAVIDVFGESGVTVPGNLTASGQTLPLIKVSGNAINSNDELVTTRNVSTTGAITVTSSSPATPVNATTDLIGGIQVFGNNVSVAGAVTENGPDAITLDTQNNMTISAAVTQIASDSGVSLNGNGNGIVQTTGAGLIHTRALNLTAKKSTGPGIGSDFNIATKIDNPGGVATLIVVGGDDIVINNGAATGTLRASTLGNINDSVDPAVDLPIGNLKLVHGGTLEIVALNNFNQARHDAFPGNNPATLEFVADVINVFGPTITTPAWTEVTIRPFHDTRRIIVNNAGGNADGSSVYYSARSALQGGLLNQFHPDAKLIVGGPDHKGNINIGGDGLFTLGNMDVTFQTNGGVIRNFFSTSRDSGGTPNSPFGPEPAIPFGNLGYPGPDVQDGLGRITSNKVHLIEAGTFQPAPGVTITGSCATTCPGGSFGQGGPAITDSPGDGGGSGGGGGGGGGSTTTGGPGGSTSGTAPGTPGEIAVTDSSPPPGGAPDTPAPPPDSTTIVGGGSGGTPVTDPGPVVADGGGTIAGDTTAGDPGGDVSGPGPGGTTVTDGTTGGDGTKITDGTTGGDGTLITDGTTGGDGTLISGGTGDGGVGDGTSGGAGGGSGLAGDPGSGLGGDGASGGTGGSGLADGSSGGAGGGSGLAGDPGSGLGGDGAAGGTGGSGLADGSSGGASGGSGLAGDPGSGLGSDGASGGTGGSGLADGSSGGAGGGSGLAGDPGTGLGGNGTGLAADGTGGGAGGDGTAGSGLASGDGGLAGGATGGGGLAGDGTSGAGGDGLAGSGTGTGAGGTGGTLADGSTGGGTGGGAGDGILGGATGGSALSGSGSDAAGTSGGIGDGVAGGGSGAAGAGDNGATGASGGLVAGADAGSGIPGGPDDAGFGGATGGATVAGSGSGESGATGGAGGIASGGATGSSGGMGTAIGSDGFGGAGGSGSTATAGSGDTGAMGGTGGLIAGADPDASGTGSTGTADGLATGGRGALLVGDTTAGGAVDGGFSGGASGGTAAGDGRSVDATATTQGGGDVLVGGEGTAGGAGSAGTDGSPRSGADDQYRLFEDERERAKLRLVGGNRLIQVQGEGVNLYRGDRTLGMGTPDNAAQR